MLSIKNGEQLKIIIIDNAKIESQDFVKYFGVNLDKKLSFIEHVKKQRQ